MGWLALGLLVKALLFVWYVQDNAGAKHMGRWALWDGDMWEYVDPIESLLRGEGFHPDHRMPGYGVPYLLLRLVFDQPQACDVLTLLQLLLATVTTYLLARGLVTVTSHRRLFLPTYALLLLSAFHSTVEAVMINESFTTSALALHVLCYMRYRSSGHNGWLVGAGALLAWAVFMRPIYGPLLLVIPLLELLRRHRHWRQRLATVVFFGLPFAVADAAWTIRNHRLYGGFHPLTNHGSFNPIFSSLPYYGVLYWVQTYGGNAYWWDPSADVRWYGFEPDAGGGTDQPIPGVPEPPGDVYVGGITPDSLAHMAMVMRSSRGPEVPEAERDSIAVVLLQMAQRWRTAYAREKPFHYQVVSRLRLLKHETIHSGTTHLFQRPFAELGPAARAWKLLQAALYWWVLLTGCVAAAVVVWRVRRAEAVLAAVVVLYGVVACPFIMRMAEIRYLVPIFPLMLLCAAWATDALMHRLRRDRRTETSPP
ncbi:MAG: hypothetical protein JNM31_03995 [Flavobacteriales bacterium]|nr:hypothetical protein [Flavobacteriales bacterium]